MEQINFVQIGIIGLVVIIVLVALGIFTGIIPGLGGNGTTNTTATSIWIPAKYFNSLDRIINIDFKEANKKINVTVKKVSDDQYEQDIINALASDSAPEIWFLPHKLLLKHKDKIALTSFVIIPERTFLDTFIDAGELFIKRKDPENPDDTDGIFGLPMTIDPLILYWNKDLFSSAAISRPPTTWDEFISDSRAITKFDGSGNLAVSGAALGEFTNIKHAKDIISMFMLQTGNPIVTAGNFQVTLGEQLDLPIDPAASTIRFFNEFSDTRKVVYSWNFSMPEALDAFASGRLGMYIGYASEYAGISEKNPHLNFDIAEMPQVRDGKIQATFGNIDALVLSKKAAQSGAAFTLMKYLISYDVQKKLRDNYLMPSVRRDLLAESSDNPKMDIFAKSAIKTRLWPDPDPELTYGIFKNMVESVSSGQKGLNESIKDAKIKLENLVAGI